MIGEDEFDFEAFDKEFEEQYQAEELEDEEVEADEIEDEVAGDDSLEADEIEDEVAVPPSREEDKSKHDSAFAQLRRERDEAKQLADWIKAMAEENGTTPEEMRSRYEESKLSQEAEKAGVPLEFLQRQTQTERELQELKEQSFNERFNSSVEATISKYEATPEDIEQTFAYARDEGLVEAVKSGAISFDALHRLAHLESFTEKKVQSALQDSLAQKKKRQSEAPLPNGSASFDGDDDLDALAKKDAEEALQGW